MTDIDNNMKSTPTPDSYFTFTLLADGTYEIKAKDKNNIPTEVILPSVYNGKAITKIGNSAFTSCVNLTSIIIPDSVTSIDANAFWNCSNLTSVTIGDRVTSIGIDAFRYCSSLTNITIPDSVTSIGNYAFNNCTSLASVTILNSVTEIDYGVFSACSSLTSITIPNSVTSIGSYAFGGCSSLTSITIPSSVTSIGSYAFNYCTSLTNITCKINTPPSISSNTFNSVPNTAIIYVPKENVQAYKTASNWSTRANYIVGIQSPVFVEESGLRQFASKVKRYVDINNFDGFYCGDEIQFSGNNYSFFGVANTNQDDIFGICDPNGKDNWYGVVGDQTVASSIIIDPVDLGNVPLELGLNNAGVTGQVLTSQGPNKTPIWTTPVKDVTINGTSVVNSAGIAAINIDTLKCDFVPVADTDDVWVEQVVNGRTYWAIRVEKTSAALSVFDNTNRRIEIQEIFDDNYLYLCVGKSKINCTLRVVGGNAVGARNAGSSNDSGTKMPQIRISSIRLSNGTFNMTSSTDKLRVMLEIVDGELQIGDTLTVAIPKSNSKLIINDDGSTKRKYRKRLRTFASQAITADDLGKQYIAFDIEIPTIQNGNQEEIIQYRGTDLFRSGSVNLPPVPRTIRIRRPIGTDSATFSNSVQFRIGWYNSNHSLNLPVEIKATVLT